jgi:hypothetical protein
MRLLRQGRVGRRGFGHLAAAQVVLGQRLAQQLFLGAVAAGCDFFNQRRQQFDGLFRVVVAVGQDASSRASLLRPLAVPVCTCSLCWEMPVEVRSVSGLDVSWAGTLGEIAPCAKVFPAPAVTRQDTNAPIHFLRMIQCLPEICMTVSLFSRLILNTKVSVFSLLSRAPSCQSPSPPRTLRGSTHHF